MTLEHDEYRAIAPVYDPLLDPFLNRIRARTAALIQETGLTRVIDLCCGTGVQCEMLKGMGIQAFGVDMSPAMLRKAATKSQDRGYVLGDAARPPFQPQACDGVILSFALHEKSPDQQWQILSQAQGLLSSLGALIVVDFCRPRRVLDFSAFFLIMAVERLAGSRHFANFRSYMKAGGLKGVLSPHAGLKPVARETFFMSTVTLELLRLTPQEQTDLSRNTLCPGKPR